MKKSILTILTLLFIQNILFAQQLYNLKKNGKFGYVDLKGNIKIPCIYDYADGFDMGLGFTKVKRDNQHFFIDTAGTEFILAEDINSITSKTQALDLRGKGLTRST